MVQNELGGRFLEVADNHHQKWNFYLEYLLSKNGLGVYALFIFLILLIQTQFFKRSSFSSFSIIVVLTHLIIVSVSQTKLYWYCLPAIPFFAYLVADTIEKTWRITAFKPKVLQSIYSSIIVLALLLQILKITTKVENLKKEYDLSISYYIRDRLPEANVDFPLKVYYSEYIEQIRFYIEPLGDQPQQIAFTDLDELEVGQQVILLDFELRKLEDIIEYELLEVYHNVRRIKVMDIKL